jgi:hypothetical protein
MTPVVRVPQVEDHSSKVFINSYTWMFLFGSLMSHPADCQNPPERRVTVYLTTLSVAQITRRRINGMINERKVGKGVEAVRGLGLIGL